MEVRQGKHQGSELGLFCTALQNVVVELPVRSFQVGLQQIIQMEECSFCTGLSERAPQDEDSPSVPQGARWSA